MQLKAGSGMYQIESRNGVGLINLTKDYKSNLIFGYPDGHIRQFWLLISNDCKNKVLNSFVVTQFNNIDNDHLNASDFQVDPQT